MRLPKEQDAHLGGFNTLIIYKDINYIKKLQQHNTHKIIIKQSVKHSTT